MRVALALCIAAAAACGTPYQPKGFLGGYSNNDLGGGRHTIDVEVNGYTSAGTALDYAYRRAGELCPDGYDVVDGSKTDRAYVYATKNFVASGTKPEVAIVVQCKSPAEPTATAEPVAERAMRVSATPASEPRNVVTGTRPIYCTSLVDDPSIGLCSLHLANCERMRADLIAKGNDNGPCEQRAGAACFNVENAIDGQHSTFCAPSVKNCETRLAEAQSNPDLIVGTATCGVYRVDTEPVAQARDGENP